MRKRHKAKQPNEAAAAIHEHQCDPAVIGGEDRKADQSRDRERQRDEVAFARPGAAGST